MLFPLLQTSEVHWAKPSPLQLLFDCDGVPTAAGDQTKGQDQGQCQVSSSQGQVCLCGENLKQLSLIFEPELDLSEGSRGEASHKHRSSLPKSEVMKCHCARQQPGLAQQLGTWNREPLEFIPLNTLLTLKKKRFQKYFFYIYIYKALFCPGKKKQKQKKKLVYFYSCLLLLSSASLFGLSGTSNTY